MSEPLICNVCGYPAHLVTGENYYAHSLPAGRTYWQQKQEFPECWNNAKVSDDTTPKVSAAVPVQPWYKRLAAAIGNAIGEAKFGG